EKSCACAAAAADLPRLRHRDGIASASGDFGLVGRRDLATDADRERPEDRRGSLRRQAAADRDPTRCSLGLTRPPADRVELAPRRTLELADRMVLEVLPIRLGCRLV